MRAVLLILLTALALPATAAASTRGPCIPGTSKPRCTIWTATAPYGTDDGDTLDVHLDGTPKRSFVHVRITGIQAMEITSYGPTRSGECHAAEAANRVDELLRAGRGKVRLTAQDPASTSRRRPLRSVSTRIGGRRVDIGSTLIGEGNALWLPHGTEYAWNQRYSVYSQLARTSAQRGLWDADYCGAGPNENWPLKLWVNANPDGSDADALEDEFATLQNRDPVNALDISGWWVRDSGLRRYTFAPGTVLAGAQQVTVRVGRGADTVADRFWNLRDPVFDNASADERRLGDGAYLFDPQGDVRASMIYPCRTVCTDPLQGIVTVQANYQGQEYVTLSNSGQAPIDLQGYRLFSRPYGYALGPDSVLAPGERLRIDVKGFPEDDEHGLKHWGLESNILANGGDTVTLKTFDDIVLACEAWGSKTCSA